MFDYDALNVRTRRLVRRRAREIRWLMRRSAEDSIDIGHKLAQVKARLGHDRFGKWLLDEFSWSQDAAWRFMRATLHFGDIPQIGEFAPAALYLLVSPTASQAARAEAMERAAAGEPMTHDLARDILDRHQAVGLTVEDLVKSAGAVRACPRPGQGRTQIDISDEVGAGDALPAGLGTATLAGLVAGVERWLAGHPVCAERRLAILAEIAAQNLAGQDYLNALLASGALPAPNTHRDVLAACRVVQTSLDSVRRAFLERDEDASPSGPDERPESEMQAVSFSGGPCVHSG